MITIFRHLNLRGNKQVLLNETVALNSPLQFVKGDLFLHAVQLFSILCCGPDLVKESISQFIGSKVATWSHGDAPS